MDGFTAADIQDLLKPKLSSCLQTALTEKNTEVLKQTNTCREILVRSFLANEIAILGWEEVMV